MWLAWHRFYIRGDCQTSAHLTSETICPYLKHVGYAPTLTKEEELEAFRTIATTEDPFQRQAARAKVINANLRLVASIVRIFNVTRERVRQIDGRALRALRRSARLRCLCGA